MEAKINGRAMKIMGRNGAFCDDGLGLRVL